MIVKPSQQPVGTIFYVTRRPDIFWEMCAPCEEVLAGPFEDQEHALSMVKTVRSWLHNVSPIDAAVPMGVLALRPGLTDRPAIQPRFERQNGECIIHAAGTRLEANWILCHAQERRESLERRISPGFEAAH